MKKNHSPEEHSRNMERIIAERNNLNWIFDSLTDGIFAHDSSMIITNFNYASERITGFSREEAIGKRCDEIFGQKLCGENCYFCETFSSHDTVKEKELKIRTKDGLEKIVILSTSPLYDRNKITKGAIAILRDITELSSLREEIKGRYHFGALIGKSSRMQEIYNLVTQIADTDATVLIHGESGTGKELIANAIHYHSPRTSGPFIKVNCSSLSENLLESELFGHVRGAFTGAIKDKVGKLQLAHRGSIFLDEIGDISLNIQAKLLRFLQEKEIERVGDTKVIKLDVRVIAATNKDLKKLIFQEKFREDLYYRLNVIDIHLPPLRERRDDIPLLVEHFLRRYSERMGKDIKGVTPECLRIFKDYSWKGNVRELEHAIEHSIIKAQRGYIKIDHLPRDIIAALSGKSAPEKGKILDERETILQVLIETGWNKSKAAKRLGINRTTIWRKIKKYDLSEPE